MIDFQYFEKLERDAIEEHHKDFITNCLVASYKKDQSDRYLCLLDDPFMLKNLVKVAGYRTMTIAELKNMILLGDGEKSTMYFINEIMNAVAENDTEGRDALEKLLSGYDDADYGDY